MSEQGERRPRTPEETLALVKEILTNLDKETRNPNLTQDQQNEKRYEAGQLDELIKEHENDPTDATLAALEKAIEFGVTE